LLDRPGVAIRNRQPERDKERHSVVETIKEGKTIYTAR